MINQLNTVLMTGLVCLLSLSLSGCGQSGDLFIPTKATAAKYTKEDSPFMFYPSVEKNGPSRPVLAGEQAARRSTKAQN